MQGLGLFWGEKLAVGHVGPGPLAGSSFRIAETKRRRAPSSPVPPQRQKGSFGKELSAEGGLRIVFCRRQNVRSKQGLQPKTADKNLSDGAPYTPHLAGVGFPGGLTRRGRRVPHASLHRGRNPKGRRGHRAAVGGFAALRMPHTWRGKPPPYDGAPPHRVALSSCGRTMCAPTAPAVSFPQSKQAGGRGRPPLQGCSRRV